MKRFATRRRFPLWKWVGRSIKTRRTFIELGAVANLAILASLYPHALPGLKLGTEPRTNRADALTHRAFPSAIAYALLRCLHGCLSFGVFSHNVLTAFIFHV
jgi:hypothetical protein